MIRADSAGLPLASAMRAKLTSTRALSLTRGSMRGDSSAVSSSSAGTPSRAAISRTILAEGVRLPDSINET